MPKGVAATYDPAKSFDFPVGTIVTKTFYYTVAGRRRCHRRPAARRQDDPGKLPERRRGPRPQARPPDRNSLAGPPRRRLGRIPVCVERGRDRRDARTHRRRRAADLRRRRGADRLHLFGAQPEPVRRVPRAGFPDSQDHRRSASRRATSIARFRARAGRSTSSSGSSRWAISRGCPPAACRKTPIGKTPRPTPSRARAPISISIAAIATTRPARRAPPGCGSTPRRVDPRLLGMCKPPVAAGRGTGNRPFDVVPGHPETSIIPYRWRAPTPAR